MRKEKLREMAAGNTNWILTIYLQGHHKDDCAFKIHTLFLFPALLVVCYILFSVFSSMLNVFMSWWDKHPIVVTEKHWDQSSWRSQGRMKHEK